MLPEKNVNELKAKAKVDETELKTQGQRRINLIWEITQATIAVGVTFSTLWVSSHMAMMTVSDRSAFLLLGNAFFLVIGFYFGRTNHQRVGGVGARNDESR